MFHQNKDRLHALDIIDKPDTYQNLQSTAWIKTHTHTDHGSEEYCYCYKGSYMLIDTTTISKDVTSTNRSLAPNMLCMLLVII